MKINEFDKNKNNLPITKKDAALYKQAQHMVMKSKIDQKPSVDMMQITNQGMRDHVKGIGQDADKLSQAAGIPRDAVKPPKPITQRSNKFTNPFKRESAGVGKITKQNTTTDVKPGETERQAKKYFGGTGKPKLLTADLSEKEKTKDELKGFDPRTVKAINNLMIKFPQAKDPLSAIIADIEDSQTISIANDKHTRQRNIQQDKQIDDLTKRVDKLEKSNVTEDEDMDTIQRAEQFAQEAHKDHKRKYTGDPYYVHLDEVRRIVKAAGGSENMQAAALLHDTVEDTATTSQDIMQEFGPAIAKLVVELTDISKPEDGNRATRKAMDRDKLAMSSADAQTIKYADLISNGRDIGVNDPKFAKVYHKEKADLLRVMRKGNQNLRNAAIDMLPDELRNIATENLSYTGTERRRLEKKKGIEVGTPEWFKHWFDLPYLREGDNITYDELVKRAKYKSSIPYYINNMLRTLHSLVSSGGKRHSLGYYAQEVGRQFGFSGRDLEKIYRKEYNISESKSVNSFTDPNFEVEWDEAKRYPEFVKIGKKAWIELAKTGKPIDVDNELANKIENTEAGEENRHEFDNLEEPKKERFRKAVEAGTVELPIIARYSDGYLELVAGNTRLTGMMNEFGEGKAWVFDVPDEVAVLGESYDDVGQKIYKGNTTRVVNTPVADKNISVADKRIAKFSQQRDMDDMTYKGAKITAPGTNQTIAKAKSNINRAYSKQDKIDQRQGAGQSYITKGKPIKFPSTDNVQLNMSEGVQKVDVEQLEKFADRLFGKVGIDVEFTRHFMDRVNDIRNQKPITMSELTRLFKQEYKRWGKPIAQMGPDSQAVMKDLQTDINLPFVLKWDDNNNELDLIAKTVMRKADFKTSNKEFPVEHIVQEKKSKEDYIRLVQSVAKKLDIDPKIAMAIAYQESGFRNVIGDKNLKNKAYGLMQVRKPALDDVNRIYKTDFTMDDVANDPAKNVEIALKYFQSMKDNYGAKNDEQALAGYNGGPGAIKGTNKKANTYAKSVISTAGTFNPPKKLAMQKPPARVYDTPGALNPQTLAPDASIIAPGTTQGGPSKLRQRLAKQPIKPDDKIDTPVVVKPKISKLRQRMMQKDKSPAVEPVTVPIPAPMPKLPTTYQDLAKNSGIKDPNKIFAGDIVNLPDGSKYTIKTGDTLSGIANFYNSGLKENVPNTNRPGTMGHMINWGGKNAPEKPKSNISVARRNNKQEPMSWWQKTLQRGKSLFDDEQLDLKKKFKITSELKQLDKIFQSKNREIRIVGGAVRDLALGKTPKDIDLATDATPQEMQRMFDSAGVKHIPTGIEHGTITAVLNGEPYEITTLRADVETDGRRAEVEFVRSWEEDAKRRDLTYNAMSMDFEGNVYDYHGGMDDLQDKVTRFVGDPAERIKEDYLRTLRYFRFQGRLDTPTFDKDTMQAIASNTNGLKQLSVERVWMEMGKILSGGNIKQILGAMNNTGVLGAIGLKYTPNNDLMDGGDPIVNLARITDDETIGPRWKMSNEEKGKLGFLLAEKGKTHDKKWYTDMMVDGFDRTQLDALARYNNQDDMIQYIKTFKAPEFPVDGNDLIKMGHERGPKIGQTLQALRNQWKQGNFSASKDELLKNITEDEEFNELDYVLKKQVKPSEAVMLTKLGKFHNGADELEQFVPERKGKQYALHPDNWKGTYYSLTNLDTKKINYYRPKVVTPPAGSIVADMYIANQFYRTNDEDKKQQLAQAYKDSMVKYGADISHIKFPEILMPRVNENLKEAPKDWGDMKLDGDKVQQSIDYFYTDHAPNNIGGRKEEGYFKGLKVVAFTKGNDTLMFLVNNQDQAVFYVAYNKFEGGVAIGNVRSNGTVKATEVYKMLVDKFGTLYSDAHQTPQGRKIWTDLTRFFPDLTVKDVGDRLVATKKIKENFADGKKKGKSRPGRVKRAGASCKGSVTSLRKKAKNSSGEKAKMYHWCANMKSGKNKSK